MALATEVANSKASLTPVTHDLNTLRLAWIALVANAVVVLQGAVVRITGSGAGCGRHWPFCNGEVVPLNPTLETGIEFSHRLLSLAVLVLGVWLFARARRQRHENPGLAVFAGASLALLAVEAGIGAATVLLGLTGDNTTVARGVWVAFHLVNSLLLIGALSATVVYAHPRRPAYPLRLGGQAALSSVLGLAVLGSMVLIFTGGIAAMGNTIFPTESLAEGFRADFDPDSHPLIRLRILHPLIAIAVGTYLFVGLGLSWWLKPVSSARRTAQLLLGVYLGQLAVGTSNLVLKGPAVLQLLHLGLAIAAFGLLFAYAAQQLGGAVEEATRRLIRSGALERA